MRPLVALLVVQLVIGAALIAAVATGNVPFIGGAASGGGAHTAPHGAAHRQIGPAGER